MPTSPGILLDGKDILQQQFFSQLCQISFRLLRFVVCVNRNPFAALGFWIDRIQIDGDLPGEVLLDDLLRQAAVRAGEAALLHQFEVKLVGPLDVRQAAPPLAGHLHGRPAAGEQLQFGVLGTVVAMVAVGRLLAVGQPIHDELHVRLRQSRCDRKQPGLGGCRFPSGCRRGTREHRLSSLVIYIIAVLALLSFALKADSLGRHGQPCTSNSSASKSSSRPAQSSMKTARRTEL